MWYAILGAVLLAGDQILKYWVVTHLAVGESAPFLPGFMQLTRLHNYGAAWSSFSGRTALKSLAEGKRPIVTAVPLLRFSPAPQAFCLESAIVLTLQI